jgi:hypothetical protein
MCRKFEFTTNVGPQIQSIAKQEKDASSEGTGVVHLFWFMYISAIIDM